MITPCCRSLVLFTLLGCDAQRVPTPVTASASSSPSTPSADEHALLAEVLVENVRPDGVDYAALRRDHTKLDAYRAQLARIKLPDDKRERMALYINAYNAWTLALVVDLLPADRAKWSSWSIKDGGSLTQNVWKKFDFELAGERLTLDRLEHERLRPMGDPRIHFAINCASRSCPSLAATPYHAQTLEAELAAATQAFLKDPTQLRLRGGALEINPILDWFAADFASLGGVRAFLRDHVVEGPIKEYLRGTGKLGFFDYDWSLNLTATPR